MAKEAGTQKGFEFKVTGQYYCVGDRGKTTKLYEEVFTLPSTYAALHIIRRHLLPFRLEASKDGYHNVRTQRFIGAPKPIADTGLSKLQKKKLEDMTSEEIRHYAILIGFPLEVIRDTPVDLDLVEKLMVYRENPGAFEEEEEEEVEEKPKKKGKKKKRTIPKGGEVSDMEDLD